jgi:hypothetical protein
MQLLVIRDNYIRIIYMHMYKYICEGSLRSITEYSVHKKLEVARGV